MKRIIIITILSAVLFSCGKKQDNSLSDVLKSTDISLLKEKKKELENEEQKISDQIAKLSDRISDLEPNKNIPLISTKKVKQAVFNHYLELQGNVQTKKNVLVYPETPGQITRIFVKEGNYIKKGQAIAKIDAGGLTSRLAQLKITADLAKTTYERQKRLWEQKIGSEIQFLQAKTNYEAQKKAVSELQKALNKYTIKAPFSGIVDDVFKETGVIVAPGIGSEICRVVNLADMYIEADIPETHLPSIKKGKEVIVKFPVLGKEIRSKVRQVGNYVNPVNRTFKIEIGIPNKNKTIKPNLTARLKINDYTNKKAITVPQSIISENAKGEQYIYIVTNKKDNKAVAKRVIIETGKVKDGLVEVTKGLPPESEVIVEGARTVKNNQEVLISTFSAN